MFKRIFLCAFVICVFAILQCMFYGDRRTFLVNATSVNTSVTVGNSFPAFTSNPGEDPASSVTTPTAAGSSVVFKVTGTDPNNENYYLIVCSTDSVVPHNGSAPTCGVSAYCVSSATASGSVASCSFTTSVSTPLTNNWYAFVCDSNATNAKCSVSNQGTGDSGSPFIVNHQPSFSSISSTASANPGGVISWNAVASDQDSNTVKLLVCKTSSITSDGQCSGGSSSTWCSSSFVASDPSCSYNVPGVSPDGTKTAYVFVVDYYNAPATGAPQGSSRTFTINNVAPVVSTITFNAGSAINLVEGTTTSIPMSATVTDNNSCASAEIQSVTAYAYRSGVGYSSCNSSAASNPNYCYPEIVCTQVAGSCSGSTDASANYTCSVSMQYFADPTDTNTQYPTENWLNTFKAIDNNALVGTGQLTTGIEVNSLTAFTITSALNFGSLGAGEKNDPLDKITVTSATGNVGIDEELSGSSMCTDYPTCSGSPNTPIAVANQKYSLSESTAYSVGTALTALPVEVELNVPKTTSVIQSFKNMWWGLLVPVGTIPGSYTGINTVTAIKGEVVNW